MLGVKVADNPGPDRAASAADPELTLESDYAGFCASSLAAPRGAEAGGSGA